MSALRAVLFLDENRRGALEKFSVLSAARVGSKALVKAGGLEVVLSRDSYEQLNPSGEEMPPGLEPIGPPWRFSKVFLPSTPI